MDEKTFKVWASGCAHVNADKKMGRDNLGEAIIGTILGGCLEKDQLQQHL